MNLPISRSQTAEMAAQQSSCSTPTEIASPTPQWFSESVEHIPDTARFDTYALDAGEYLSHHEQEGLAGLRQWLNDQHLLCETESCSNALVADNLDEDSLLEYVMALSSPDLDPSLCYHAPSLAYILDCQYETPACQIYRLHRMYMWESSRCISAVSDINQDNRSEVLIYSHSCGASDCWDGMDIVAWENGSYRHLNPNIRANNGCILGRKQSGTNRMEFLAASSNAPGSAGMQVDQNGQWTGPYQSGVSIYQWDGQQYAFAGQAFSIDSQFDVIQAGITWAMRGESETALAVFNEILTSEDDEAFPWRAYAQFAVGMLQARIGRIGEAHSALNQVKEFDEQGIFAPAADVFLQAYGDGCYASACEELTKYVDGLPDGAPFLSDYHGNRLIWICTDEPR